MDFDVSNGLLEREFPLKSPTFMFSVLAIYLLLIYKILPDYMKHRPAYKLKLFISIYNVAQISSCLYIVTEILNITGFVMFYFRKCHLFPKDSPADLRFVSLSHFAFWLKMAELSETIIFVLRKKYNQVSLLHVFHHSVSITLIYLLSKCNAGGATLYPLFLNSIVHVIMYTYYLLAAVCSQKFVKRLLPIKKSITTIQMIQFMLILKHMALLNVNCDLPKILFFYYFIVIIVIFYGFYDFYKNSYTKKSHRKTPKI